METDGGRIHIFHFFTQFAYGGLELRTARIVNALGDGFRHTICAIKGHTEALDRLDPSLAVEVVDPPHESGPLYPLKLRALLARAAPDLALTYNWGAIKAVIGACWRPVCPVIHHEGGLKVNEATKRLWRRSLARRIFLNRIHRTVVVSSTLERMAREEFGLRPEKVTLIRSGIDTGRFHPGRDCEIRRALDAGEGELLFGFVGMLRPEKDLGTLLEGFKAADIGNARLVLVGDGPCRAEAGERVRALGLANRVVFAGAAQDPAPYYRAFDVFVMSSATEQTPNALLEAMATGLPAVTTGVGDCAEMLGDSADGCVTPPGDVRAYADALRRLASDAALRDLAGRRNRARVVAEYSAERMYREYRELYQGAVQGGVRRGRPNGAD